MEFQYEGVDRQGKRVSGRLEAPGEGELRMELRKLGVRPTRISRASGGDLAALLGGGSGKGSVGSATSVPLAELVVFFRQLQVLISSGVPLVQSLGILGSQTPNANLRAIVREVEERVVGGMAFWEALAGFPRAFPKLGVALIRAGESSGSLDQMLKRLVRYVEDADRLARMLRSAMIYPVMVVLVGLGVIAFLLMVVIPKFEAILTQGGQELPGPTQFVITVSHALADNFLLIAAVLGAAVAGGVTYFRSPEGRALRDRMLFRAPLFGPLVQKAGIARFSRTMATLLSSGVSLIEAIDICRSTIDNAVLEEAVGGIRSEVEAGKPLGSVVGAMGVFPNMAVQMISVGENTGALDRMLEKIADFYEQEVETLVGGLTKLIEPLILVFLGGTVGGLMIAMYLPIFQIAGGGGGP